MSIASEISLCNYSTTQKIKTMTAFELMGEEIALGNSYYIGGELQEVPHEDVVSDFEEIDAIVEEEGGEE